MVAEHCAAIVGVERAGQAAIGGDGEQQMRPCPAVADQQRGALGCPATVAARAAIIRSMRLA